MKWFKHSSGSLNNSFIFELVERFGGDGYLVFFGTLELMSDEFDIYFPGHYCVSIKKLAKNLQLSRQKTLKILAFCDQKAKEKPKENVAFFVEIYKDHVSIFCNRLAELSDNHTQKLLRDTSKLDQSNNKVSSSQEEEEEEEEDKNKYSDDSLEVWLSKYLYGKIIITNPKFKEPNFQNWAVHIDRLIRIDKRSPTEIKSVIDWCHDVSDFWYKNILSTAKLREKYDELLIKMSPKKTDKSGLIIHKDTNLNAETKKMAEGKWD